MDNKRTCFVGFYATDEERDLLKANADKLGMTVSAYLRYKGLYEQKEEK